MIGKRETKTFIRTSKLALKEYCLLGIILILYSIIQLQLLNKDFWNDEIYTLKHFVFPSLTTVLTDYHVPNNHVFFNILNWIYLKCRGLSDLYQLMDSPYQLRLLSFSYALATLIITYFLIRRFFNKTVALLSVALMTTTIPFYNTATQIRGYGLSTLLVVVVLFFCWEYMEIRRKRYLVSVCISTALLLYTIPSNTLFVMGLLAFYGGLALVSTVRTEERLSLKRICQKPSFMLSLGIIGGIVLAVVLYLPVIGDVLFNPYIVNDKPFGLFALTSLPYHVLLAFLSGRWLLVLLFLIGMYNFANYSEWFEKLLLLFTLVLTSFIICFIRGGQIPMRIFVIFVPVACIFLSVGVYSFIRSVPKWRSASLLFAGLIYVYAIGVFSLQLKKIDARILSDIKSTNRSHNIYYNYYIPRYEPQKVLKTFKATHYADSIPVILHRCEPHDLPVYLDKFEIDYYHFEVLDSVMVSNQNAFILSNHPVELMESTSYRTSIVSQEYSYLNVVMCQK